MQDNTDRKKPGNLLRLGVITLAGVMVFHLVSPGLRTIGRASEEATTEVTPTETTAPGAEHYLTLAEEAIKAEDYDTALCQLSVAQGLITPDEGDLAADILIKTVSIQVLQENYSGAIDSIDDFRSSGNVLEDDSLYGVLEFLRGGCLVQLGDHTGALEAFSAAMDQGYDRAACLEQMIYSYAELGENEALVAAGEALLSIENVQLSDPALVYQQLAISGVFLGDYERALGWMDQSESQGVILAGNSYYRGICLMSLGRQQEAIEAFTVSIEGGELPAYSYYNRGICFVDLEDYEKAALDMEKTLELQPEPELTGAAQDVLDQLNAYLT